MTKDSRENNEISLVIDKQTLFRFITPQYSVKFWYASLAVTDEKKVTGKYNLFSLCNIFNKKILKVDTYWQI